MIEVILYANKERGYGCYEHTSDFPTDYIPLVEKACGKCEAKSNSSALRFSALGDKYLLSCIFRGITSDAEDRLHYVVMNYLADPEDMDTLMSVSTVDLAAVLMEISASMLEKQKIPERGIEAGDLIANCKPMPAARQNGDDLHKALYVGAICSGMEDVLETQVFAAADKTLTKIQWILARLPLKLRKHVSFHSGIQSASESVGISLSLCSPKVMSSIKASAFDGGMSTTKVIFTDNESGIENYYGLYRNCAEVLVSMSDGELSCVEELFGDAEDMRAYLEIADAYTTDELTGEHMLRVVDFVGEKRIVELITQNKLPESWRNVLIHICKKEKRYPAIASKLITRSIPEKDKDKDTDKNTDTSENPVIKQVTEGIGSSTKMLKQLLLGLLVPLAAVLYVFLSIRKFLISTVNQYGIMQVELSIDSVMYAVNTCAIAVLSAVAGFLLCRLINSLNNKK